MQIPPWANAVDCWFSDCESPRLQSIRGVGYRQLSMALSIKFNEARLGGMALAKVGNPLRDEPLQTSRTLCHFEDADAELLTHCFLKSFKSLELHHLHHHTEIESNEVFGYATAVFENNDVLLDSGQKIAKHLHAKSNRPNIKSGDLCVSLINDVIVGSEKVQAISIIKSESKVPFLQISEENGDLRLKTQQGIYPDKIDKGCLIVNYDRDGGYAVYLFDKSGNNPMFWNRDFLGALPVRNDDYLTKRYSELCVKFAGNGLPDDVKSEERREVADRAISYIADAESFDLEEFQNVALKEPDRIEQFNAFKSEYEEEAGQELKPNFTVSKPEAKKAQKRLRGKMKLDTGVDLKFSTKFVDQAHSLLERGFDDRKKMKFLKIYFHNEEDVL
ncbi:MAG: hypothetical protein ACI9R3_002714 [Verrucomicrobiales bacterium]|jgi:hypothetical protein